MIDELRIRGLVEEALESERTPEEVCREFPELLDHVRNRYDRVRNLEGELEVLFPASDSTPGTGEVPKGARPAIPGYEVEGVLGHGGMGVVYRARHLKLDREVAIKMLLAGAYASPRELARFLLEARAVANLCHPNIVQVFDVGELEGRPFFTMELLGGGSLAQRLNGAPQAATVAAAMVRLLAQAVEFAHGRGTVHRDLKPANVLLASDGTPKVADFGLAMKVGDGAALSGSGTILGTPSYMAPEQVRGSASAIGPAADVYALGAILYEMLTGRPPFRSESALATQVQVLSEEPVLPTRLNARVPRDLETICLKCLQKEPQRRYPTAAALAEDLDRFQRDEPITARRTGPAERALKWVRRRPAQATAVTGGTLLVLAVLGAVLWLGLQRAATERSVSADLLEAAQRGRASEWVAARTALERAKARIGNAGSEKLRGIAEQAERDLDLVARLDAIRLQRAAVVEGRFDLSVNNARADSEYEEAFRTSGWGNVGDETGLVAARIAGSNIRDALLAALDDWALCAARSTETGRQDWLLEVAGLVDPDPTGLRLRVRDPAAPQDWATLLDVAGKASHGDPSLPCLLALAGRLAEAGNDSIPLLRQVQQRHPGDFWANMTLGDALVEEQPREALRYYQAALALRPGAAVAHNNLGHALGLEGHADEAIDRFREALRLDPRFVHAQANLGNTLLLLGRKAEAIEAYQQALALDPSAASTRANLARALVEDERLDEALDQAQQAVALDPDFANAQINLGVVLMLKGRVDEAIDLYRKAIALDEASALAHTNLGYALMARGRVDEGIQECRRALELDPSWADAHSCLCQGLRASGHLDEAIEHGQESVRIDPGLAGAHNNLGAALAVSGRLDEAIEHLREGARLDPTEVRAHTNLGNALGMKGDLGGAVECFREALRLDPDSAQGNGSLGQALLGLGRLTEARDALRRAVDLVPQGGPLHDECSKQLKLCERLMELENRIPALLDGRHQPTDGAEALELAILCRIQRRHATAAQLYADAFDFTPTLAEDPRMPNRYDAACCAALAGRDPGSEADDLGPDERARWRETAREWLRADLDRHAAALDGGSAASRAYVLRTLMRWRGEPDLAGLRDPVHLDELPVAERTQCLALWGDVDDLVELVQR